MPIYEFYCSDCHTVFNFLSRAVNTKRRPRCPRCARPRLERRASRFAVSVGRTETPADDGLPDGIDEQRLDRAMQGLASEAERLDENDAAGMARLMHKLFDSAGMEVGDGMREALRRLEAGEDPEQIEAEMGDLLDGEDPLALVAGGGLASWRRRLSPPAVDETLYEL